MPLAWSARGINQSGLAIDRGGLHRHRSDLKAIKDSDFKGQEHQPYCPRLDRCFGVVLDGIRWWSWQSPNCPWREDRPHPLDHGDPSVIDHPAAPPLPTSPVGQIRPVERRLHPMGACGLLMVNRYRVHDRWKGRRIVNVPLTPR